MPYSENGSCGTVAPTTEAVMDAVREVRGRRPVRPAQTIEDAEAEIRDFIIVPGWYTGEPAADVAADALRGLNGVDPSGFPFLWALYTEGARRLGFRGAVPVPQFFASGPSGTGRQAES